MSAVQSSPPSPPRAEAEPKNYWNLRQRIIGAFALGALVAGVRDTHPNYPPITLAAAGLAGAAVALNPQMTPSQLAVAGLYEAGTIGALTIAEGFTSSLFSPTSRAAEQAATVPEEEMETLRELLKQEPNEIRSELVSVEVQKLADEFHIDPRSASHLNSILEALARGEEERHKLAEAILRKARAPQNLLKRIGTAAGKVVNNVIRAATEPLLRAHKALAYAEKFQIEWSALQDNIISLHKLLCPLLNDPKKEEKRVRYNPYDVLTLEETILQPLTEKYALTPEAVEILKRLIPFHKKNERFWYMHQYVPANRYVDYIKLVAAPEANEIMSQLDSEDSPTTEEEVLEKVNTMYAKEHNGDNFENYGESPEFLSWCLESSIERILRYDEKFCKKTWWPF